MVPGRCATPGINCLISHVAYDYLDDTLLITNTVHCCRVREFRRFSEKSDVYSFGVFLLELVSGQEATESSSFDSNQNLVEWVNHGLRTILMHCSYAM